MLFATEALAKDPGLGLEIFSTNTSFVVEVHTLLEFGLGLQTLECASHTLLAS